MDAVRKRKVDAVLVFRFDRFARSTAHLARALEEFRTLGVQFISYSENIDTSTPIGAAIFTMVSAMAQLERDIIKERVRAGLNVAKAKGIHLGRRYRIDAGRVRQLRNEGLSYRAIAKIIGCSIGAIPKILKR